MNIVSSIQFVIPHVPVNNIYVYLPRFSHAFLYVLSSVFPLNQSIINPLTRANCHAGQTLNNCLCAHIGQILVARISRSGIFWLREVKIRVKALDAIHLSWSWTSTNRLFVLKIIRDILHVFGRLLYPQLKCVDLNVWNELSSDCRLRAPFYNCELSRLIIAQRLVSAVILCKMDSDTF